MEQALDRFIPRSAIASPPDEVGHVDSDEIGYGTTIAEFVPSPTWAGVKKGYFFGTGSQGTGYYIDDHQKSNLPHARPRKTVSIAEDQNEMKLLLEQLETTAARSSAIELSAKGVLAAGKSLESIYKKNAMQRAKFHSEPDKYMESELALYEQLMALQAVATDTKLYRHVENSNLMATLVQLLGHENTDIPACVVALFLEWIDPTLVTEDPTVLSTLKRLGKTILVQGWETMVINLARFQSDEDTQDNNLKGVENTLSVFENLMELHSLALPNGILDDESLSVAGFMARESKIISWLFLQLDSSLSSPARKARCMELLAFAAQDVDLYDFLPDWASLPPLPKEKPDVDEPLKTKQKDTPINGIEILLQSIAVYRKKQPESDLEVETLENACLSLSSCIALSRSNRNLSAFLEGQGVELVIRCLKERVHAGGCGLKLLDFMGDDRTHKKAAERVVAAGGLKFLFPIFLGTRIPKPAEGTNMQEQREWFQETSKQTIRILYALTLQLDEKSPEDAKSRFIAKFVEASQRNCDRLVELLIAYDERARKAEYKFYMSGSEDIDDENEQLSLAAFHAKLIGGGDVCHRIAATSAFVCVNSKRCHERIISQLTLRQSGLSLLKDNLSEFCNSLRDGSQQRLAKELLAKI